MKTLRKLKLKCKSILITFSRELKFAVSAITGLRIACIITTNIFKRIAAEMQRIMKNIQLVTTSNIAFLFLIKNQLLLNL